MSETSVFSLKRAFLDQMAFFYFSPKGFISVPKRAFFISHPKALFYPKWVFSVFPSIIIAFQNFQKVLRFEYPVECRHEMFLAFAVEEWAYGGTAHHFVHAVGSKLCPNLRHGLFPIFCEETNFGNPRILHFAIKPRNEICLPACLAFISCKLIFLFIVYIFF
jgi:hypothetical protein